MSTFSRKFKWSENSKLRATEPQRKERFSPLAAINNKNIPNFDNIIFA
jgi:hypothetical protein